MKDSPYFKQAELLLRILPIINRHPVFSLKGGTAINFFVRNLPRLSVDIDLVYLPVKERTESLKEISDTLIKIDKDIKRIIPALRITGKVLPQTNFTDALIIAVENATVKIQSNTVFRGSVYPTVSFELCEKAQQLFELSLKVTSLCFEELYAGKICAALDRQHPRDLFDIKLLFENEGINEKIRKAFLVYLISHNRPIVELLNPGLIEISDTFLKEFSGMTAEEITPDKLLETRVQLIKEVKTSLTEKEKQFLISFKNLNPDWSLLELDGIENLPAVKWKLQNLKQMDQEKHKRALNKLSEYLNN